MSLQFIVSILILEAAEFVGRLIFSFFHYITYLLAQDLRVVWPDFAIGFKVSNFDFLKANHQLLYTMLGV